ncbi:MAG: hypothetical protein JNJ56_05260 [Ignavibacteria bacterium]|nr:hypothetical protein [Ignavibacteria bacterium]
MKSVKIIYLFLFIFFFSLFSPSFILPQYKTDFTAVYKSLKKPPLTCKEASELTVYDSVTKKFKLDSSIILLEAQLKKIQSEIAGSLSKMESMKDQFQGQQGNMPPPGNMPSPGNGRSQQDFLALREKLDNCRDASDKIMEETDKLQKEISAYQENVNKLVKSTLADDSKGRELIINEFLTNVALIYNKHYSVIIQNVNIIEGTLNNNTEQYISNIMPLTMAVLKCGESEVYGALFLFNITRECIKTGAKFYYEANP